MSQFGINELALRMDMLKFGVSNGNNDDMCKTNFDLAVELYLRE
jgi:hypothetical protein